VYFKRVTEEYLAEFPQYKHTFRAYLCASADGDHFVKADSSDNRFLAVGKITAKQKEIMDDLQTFAALRMD